MTSGRVEVLDVPPPALRSGGVLVQTSHSLISAGTEAATVGTSRGREPLAMKALRNPALVRKVIDRAATHGVRATAELVRSRLSSSVPLGYASAGVVIAVSPDIDDLRTGDRVACAGAGYANHAAVNFVPRRLVAPLDDRVPFEQGAFATLGAIALQAVRRASPTLGEVVIVVGLGLLGQLAAQLLRASGARVIGVDVRSDRVERARALGMTDGFSIAERDLVEGVMERTGGHGADAVIVAAAGSDPAVLYRAFDACRRKGRVVLLGDVPIRIPRDRMYKKEIDFLISTSYGPGRYDPDYEERGHDYPLAYVRWTEERNLQEVVRLMATGELGVAALIDQVFPVDQAAAAYEALRSDARPVGVLLQYPVEAPRVRPAAPAARQAVRARLPIRVGVIGYGSYFRSMLLPLLKKRSDVALVSACARTSLTVQDAVARDGFARGTTEPVELLADDVDLVFVATRHDSHALLVRQAIEAGKAVFVEKPLALTSEDAAGLVALAADRGALLTVGFNRRFSPHVERLRTLLRPIRGPKSIVYRVNAGALPAEHWLLHPDEGGGRLLGEAVHFFDLVRFLVDADPVRVVAAGVASQPRNEATTLIAFPDGSVGVVVYAAGGSPESGKERIEVFAGGASFVLDDFRELTATGSRTGSKTRHVDKGQSGQLDNVFKALAGRQELGVTALDGYWATWCAEEAIRSAVAFGTIGDSILPRA